MLLDTRFNEVLLVTRYGWVYCRWLKKTNPSALAEIGTSLELHNTTALIMCIQHHRERPNFSDKTQLNGNYRCRDTKAAIWLREATSISPKLHLDTQSNRPGCWAGRLSGGRWVQCNLREYWSSFQPSLNCKVPSERLWADLWNYPEQSELDKFSTEPHPFLSSWETSPRIIARQFLLSLFLPRSLIPRAKHMALGFGMIGWLCDIQNTC